MSEPRFSIEVGLSGQLLVRGELTFATVERALEVSSKLFASESTSTDSIAINLKGVRRVDSAGLSILLEWMRYFRQQQKTVFFDEIPNSLQRLSRIGGVESLLLSVTATRPLF